MARYVKEEINDLVHNLCPNPQGSSVSDDVYESYLERMVDMIHDLFEYVDSSFKSDVEVREHVQTNFCNQLSKIDAKSPESTRIFAGEFVVADVPFLIPEELVAAMKLCGVEDCISFILGMHSTMVMFMTYTITETLVKKLGMKLPINEKTVEQEAAERVAANYPQSTQPNSKNGAAIVGDAALLEQLFTSNNGTEEN